MTDGSSGSGPLPPGYGPRHQPEPDTVPLRPIADGAPGPAAPAPAVSGGRALEVVRYGPGVPAGQAGAEEVWRTGRPPGPPPRRARRRRVLGLVFTVLLLAAAGVVVWLRFFDHSPLHVTDVALKDQPGTGCAVNVTGTIATNGAAGVISYRWEFRPQTQAPPLLRQSVTAGQHTVDVTIAVEGQGHGRAVQTVTLDVLDPPGQPVSMPVNLSC